MICTQWGQRGGQGCCPSQSYLPPYLLPPRHGDRSGRPRSPLSRLGPVLRGPPLRACVRLCCSALSHSGASSSLLPSSLSTSLKEEEDSCSSGGRGLLPAAAASWTRRASVTVPLARSSLQEGGGGGLGAFSCACTTASHPPTPHDVPVPLQHPTALATTSLQCTHVWCPRCRLGDPNSWIHGLTENTLSTAVSPGILRQQSRRPARFWPVN